ncbi:hypothetical protein TorRG33x02_298610, partial [Trema orientale]
RKRKGNVKEISHPKNEDISEEITTLLKEVVDVTEQITSEKLQVPNNIENKEISISYVSLGKEWNRDKVIVDNVFAYVVAVDIINESEDLEPKSINECRRRNG